MMESMRLRITKKQCRKNLVVCRDSECETPGTRETGSSILQVEQESGADLLQSENDVGQLDVIDELDVLEQGKEVPEVREYKDQNVEEALALQEEDDITEPTCYLENIRNPGSFFRIQVSLLTMSVEHLIPHHLLA